MAEISRATPERYRTAGGSCAIFGNYIGSAPGDGVALSSLAEQVYEKLGERPANRGSLIKKLNLDDEELIEAIAELSAAGLAMLEGSRVRRTSIAGAGNLSLNATHVLARIPPDGSSIGGLRLRGLVDLPNEDYRSAIDELKENAVVRLGPGRGGTVSRVEHAEATPTESAPGLVDKEERLYSSFKDWLLSSLETQGLTFAHAAITGSPKGRRRQSGKWSRPDVTSIEVSRSEWLPDALLTISSFEIKRARDSEKLESVYEAQAHSRWAHKSSLVIETDPRGESDLADDVIAEIKRFGLGLYTMQIRHDGTYKIEQEVAPGVGDPDAAQMNDLLEHYFEINRDERDAYKASIGR